MKRRSFLKGLLMIAAAPVAARSLIKDDEPGLTKSHLSDVVKVMRDRAIPPSKDGNYTVWGVNTEGGYMYSDELSKQLTEMAKPIGKGFGVSHSQVRQADQDAYNALCNKRLDNIKLVNN